MEWFVYFCNYLLRTFDENMNLYFGKVFEHIHPADLHIYQCSYQTISVKKSSTQTLIFHVL